MAGQLEAEIVFQLPLKKNRALAITTTLIEKLSAREVEKTIAISICEMFSFKLQEPLLMMMFHFCIKGLILTCQYNIHSCININDISKLTKDT